MAKTKEDVERLKQQWTADPCWDIETTDEYEEFADELKAFSDEKHAEWKARRDAGIEQARTWQLVCKDSGDYTNRMKVPGGWLVRHVTYSVESGIETAVGMVFLPDANHSWAII